MEETPDRDIRCASCVFWDMSEYVLKGVKARGICSRYPPQIALGSDGSIYSVFPETNATNWCGEWACEIDWEEDDD